MRLRHVVIAACAAIVLVPVAAVYGVLRASLPPLDGQLPANRPGNWPENGQRNGPATGYASGLSAPVKIQRDRLGVPTIEAANRVDLAYGTGFVHGQDRFFQMDLSRRLAAGELSELFGKVAVEQDSKARLFRFRHVAREVVQQGTPEQRAVLEAYARGVNAGLASLNSRPWEYWVLGSPPAPWQPEDTVLVVDAMWWDLQANGFRREMLRRDLNAHLGGKECDGGWKCALQFLYPARSVWDAPIGLAAAEAQPAAGRQAGDTSAEPPIPGPDVLDVRAASAASGAPAEPTASAGPGSAPSWSLMQAAMGLPRARGDSLPSVHEPAAGSNNWAISGKFTSTGAALIASDMHLGQRVPAVWYRARLRIAATAAQPAVDLNGVTLPGAPILVAGSNGHIAWGFTNSYGDWLDVTRVPCTSVGEDELQTASGRVGLSVERQEIRVHNGTSVMLEVKSGPAGVLLLAEAERQTCWFGTWLAQLPAATNMNLMGLEHAHSVDEALALAPGIGIPHQNVVVGDRDGHIGWTIFGRIPTDTGSTRSDGRSAWTVASNHPRIVDPPAGRIWTANARVTADPAQEAAIGGDEASLGAEYDIGARAQQIRDDLLALEHSATPADMLGVQLDDRAVFLTRWHDLLLRLIDAGSAAGHPQRAEFRKLVEDWNGRASVDSVGYRLVRAFRDHTERSVWDMLAGVLQIPPAESAIAPSQFEEPLWRLVNEQPMHLLAANFASWQELLLAQLDGTIDELQKSCGTLSRCTWGSRKIVRIQHPISRALPILAPLLDMPTVELPGDHDMPRVQDGAFGASERFAVSPGHEDQGYLHYPGGQSGHPLSPYYRAGFLEWARGEPLPFLPGPAEHELVLTP